MHWRTENLLALLRLYMIHATLPPNYEQLPNHVVTQIIRTSEWMIELFDQDLTVVPWVATGADQRDIDWMVARLDQVSTCFWPHNIRLLNSTIRSHDPYFHELKVKDELLRLRELFPLPQSPFDPIAAATRRVLRSYDEEFRLRLEYKGLHYGFTREVRSVFASCSRSFGNIQPDLWRGLILTFEELMWACLLGNYKLFDNLGLLIEAAWRQVEYTGYGYAIQGEDRDGHLLLTRFTRSP